jgi:hypothetical protein
MTANRCVVCGRPEPDAPACTRCTARARGHLLEIGELIADARDVAYGLSGSQGDAGASAVPGSRVPLNLGAGAKLDGVAAELYRIAENIWTIRTTYPPFADTADPIAVLARWLPDQLEWLRHRSDANTILADIAACARVMRGVVAGPVELRYLGPCGAEIETCGVGWQDEHGDHWACDLPSDHPGDQHVFHDRDLPPCDGDVYGRPNAEKGRCRTCKAEHDQDARRKWLDETVRGYTYTAREIADAYEINVKTIRSWADRGHLTAHGQDRDGRPLYNLGDVLDLAARDAARRAENEAKRTRRESAQMG